MDRLVVGISGGSGPILGFRLLEELRARTTLELHLVATKAAIRTLAIESPECPWERVKQLAHRVHPPGDIAAPISSGSFTTRGMVVIPASMKTVAAIAYGLGSNLLVRAADVTLKERRNLVVVPRETPLHLGHLETLARLARLGACVLPPMIAFYHRPETVGDVIDHTIGKVLDQIGVEHDLFQRWEGASETAD